MTSARDEPGNEDVSRPAENQHNKTSPRLDAGLEIPASFINAYRIAQEQDEKRDQARARRDRWTLGVGWALLTVLTLYGVVTCNMWREMARTAAQTDELIRMASVQTNIANRQLASMEKLANAARSQIDQLKANVPGAKTSARATQDVVKPDKVPADADSANARPWLASTMWDYLGVRNSRQVFSVTFKNIGRTPALDPSATWEFTFVHKGDLKPTYSGCPSGPEFHRGSISADNTWQMEIQTAPLTDTQNDMLAKGSATLYIHGCVKHRDDSETRVTEVVRFYPSAIGGPRRIVAVYEGYSKVN